jgi:hypothetical protein
MSKMMRDGLGNATDAEKADAVGKVLATVRRK